MRRSHRPSPRRTSSPTYTPHLIAQARRVAELTDAGYERRQIAAELGVTGERVSQIRSKLRELAPYLGRPDPLDRLRGRRDQLWRLRLQVLELAAAVRRDLRALDEELQAGEIDRILGLRRA